MNVKKFTAATSREALRKVREALGPDAVILSNRPVDGVVEILALDNDDVASLASPAPESEMAAPRPHLNHLQEPSFDAPAPRAFQQAPAARPFVARTQQDNAARRAHCSMAGEPVANLRTLFSVPEASRTALQPANLADISDPPSTLSWP